MLQPSNTVSKDQLAIFRNELTGELKNILNYWLNYTVDEVNGGYWGKINHDNQVIPGSPKGSVLNARILWSFSAAYNQDHDEAYLQAAKRAYDYIKAHFVDDEFGGVYWSVDYKGDMPDTKKQVYANAFAIYALSEYYVASKLERVKQEAIGLYHLLIDKSYDKDKTGYLEAFTRDWQPLGDLRLSAKDANEKKP